MSLVLLFDDEGVSCPAHISDHVQRALDRMTTPAKGTKLQALVTVLAQRWQLMEDVVCALIVFRFLDAANGVTLDDYGALVGEARAGATDEVYRRFIRARILSNRSSGTIDEMTKILSLLVDVEPIEYRPDYPAGMMFWYVTTNPPIDPAVAQRATRQMTEVAPAGVEVHAIVEALTGYFGFFADANALGFNAGVWANDITND